ncbi:MAG: hypothetical protein A3C43_03615 [Candidatus Schekmanbacteria bacterium RIFCSPHIGHO2_02_FULL_38_11]|uniref:SHS2 domain-containing protein n=1 Tax=Candidatus Schekmanbacteria bacterium RIFCSPLOWO2_12_FULL_38_15 TaxID=1817883 RepID=A0A1F7SLU2_9BACT|nr:MAG: hypothetical protein A2043_08855 [Candidatus Schekmanbacteria bacterium GWA2_38_9]OGL49993.1 MAG: hypothetical protein A3C43_03615 [Candidatus Schekmanbacteria bacterium RIFCSPHIGHO2_02_FULL_38_11]OGL51223.1 MAG: hypothetical protein A3H37_10435 [Candidatus Schekmanbacteria bacterium RIFCSPLOWO2_02_FULL_38_14]OGL54174.1 MAG: hypothetical protein A3G31_05275 [Candidatus Schekmanbacteria bacterium RIFCSPLOWO2_12_FULL_38_15]
MLFSEKQVVGLDIGSSLIKAFQIAETKKGFRLLKFAVKDVVPDAIVDGAIMDSASVVQAIKEILKEMKIKKSLVSTAIAGHSVIVKRINVNKMTEDELREAISLEAEQYIPFGIDDVNMDFHIIGDSKAIEGQMEIILAAAKKEQINEYSNLIRETGLMPVIVDLAAFALQNCYEANYEEEDGKTIAIVSIGASSINTNILKNRISSFVRDIPLGGKQYTEAIQKELQLSFSEAEKLKKSSSPQGGVPPEIEGILNGVSEEICQEIKRSFDFFKTQTSEADVDKIYLCGGSSKVFGLDKILSSRIGIEVSMLDPFRRVKIDEKSKDFQLLKEIAPMSGIGVGLAIRKF